MVAVRSNFFEDIRAQVVAWFAQAGITLPQPGDLEPVLFAYFSVRRRLIPVRHRSVEWSRELRARALSADQASAVAVIEQQARGGVDLTPRLSKSILNPEFNDGLLDDWGIHHLHLSSRVAPDGFVERGGPLLFVMVRPETMYFVELQAPATWQDGVFTPAFVREAVRAIQSCPFNHAGVARHLDELHDAIASAADEDEREYRRYAYQNDKACADRVRAGCQLGKAGIAYYQPEYRTAYTGRITEIGGGAQSCSREMKAAMFNGIPNLRNYDLKRAQAFVLLQELEDAGLPRDWVRDYVHDPDANDTCSAGIGIGKDAYKRCLYATIMGAQHARLYDEDKNEVFNVLLGEAHGNRARAEELTLRVYAALKPLKEEVQAWREYLLTDPKCPRVDPSRTVRTLKNACGQRFRLDGERADVLKRRAAAFILQGQEGAFIHRLTVMGKEHGFLPVSNQHDGLVVLGTIPSEAVAAAAQAAGLRYATMEEKPFL